MKKISIITLTLSVLLIVFAASADIPKGVVKEGNRLQIAEAMFQERCKRAGEKIYRTIHNVEGVFLMKIRPQKDNFSNQFALDDPYGRDFGGDAYIKSFLRGFFEANYKRPEGVQSSAPPHIGYRYVEAIDSRDGKRYRYTGSVKAVGKMDINAPNVQLDLKRNPNFDINIYAYVLDRTLATGEVSRYGVTYEDISTKEEREYWIAGSSLKVIDVKTNEVIAERIGYMMDKGQGSMAGGRSPWLFAADHACPPFASQRGFTVQPLQTENFVEKVLKPSGKN